MRLGPMLFCAGCYPPDKFGHASQTFRWEAFKREKLVGTSFTSAAMFEELRHQQGIVYDDAIVPRVAVKKMNDIYKLSKVKCPDEIPLKERLEDR